MRSGLTPKSHHMAKTVLVVDDNAYTVVRPRKTSLFYDVGRTGLQFRQNGIQLSLFLAENSPITKRPNAVF